MSLARSVSAVRVVLFSFFVSMTAAAPLLAQTAASVNSAVAWLNAQQRGNGTYAGPGIAGEDLIPRDTARVVIAQTLLKQSNANLPIAFAWLGSQGALEANQFLAEQAIALTLGKVNAAPVLGRLAQQRSSSAPDFGGFAEYNGNSYDSAIAVQAFASNEQLYTTAISGAVTTLLTRQNADGGWGFDKGFESNPQVTAEVLIALSMLKTQQPARAVITAAQGYLSARRLANGSYGDNVLETAVAYRALALSGYPLSSLSAATMTYLQSQQATAGPTGSWGNGDVFTTARVLEAFAANKANLTINTGDFTLTPAAATDGATVKATIKVTNIGAATSTATTVTLYIGDVNGRTLGTVSVAALAPGASSTLTINFTATNMTGRQTLAAVIDASNAIDEMRKDDNTATTDLVVDGKPDLQIYGTDILTSPTRVQPDDPATLSVAIRNYGDGDAVNVGYAIYDSVGGTETLLRKASVDSIPAGTAQQVTLQVTLVSGTHTVRVVVDPDLLIAETSETNNSATKSITVAAVSRVDLRIGSGAVVASPSRPNAGDPITVTAFVENTGTDPVQSRVAFFDGAPGNGGVAFAILPVTIDAQASVQLQANYVTGPTSRVVYAVADPDNILFEMDERNNQAYAALTDQYADISIAAEGLVLPKGSIAAGQSIAARVVVRNTGVVDATGVQVVIYDDIEQHGGKVIVDKTVDIPAQGKVVVPATWVARAGQRFATAVANASRSVFEVDYGNNRVTRLYTVNGNETDIRLASTRANSVDVSRLIVNPSELTVMGNAELELTGPTNKTYTIMLFEDVNGDGAYNPEVDNTLGSSLSHALSPQAVQVVAEGSVRFAPGKLYFYLDATNVVNEVDESNNFIDAWQDCQTAADTFAPGVKWQNPNRSGQLAPVARVLDTNGDDVVDSNDVPYIVMPSGGSIALLRGDSGAPAWVQNFNFSGRQIAPVIADVDNDGKPEIIVHDYEHKLVALNGNGTRKWTSPNLDRHPDWESYVMYVDYSYVGAPIVADLDGDGKPEVISGRTCLNGADGTVKWVGSGGAGRAWAGDHLYWESFPDQEAPVAVDLNNDGKLEVVAGNTAYRHDGTILWQRGDLTDGYAGPVFVNNAMRIALVTRGKVYLLNGLDGATMWGPVNIPGGALLGGAPTFFTDGGGGPWIGVAGDGTYSVLNASTGAVRWTKTTTTDLSFGITTTNAATAFDFGTGMTLVYAARDKLILMRSSDGFFHYTLPITTGPYHPMSPVVADVDDDGRADIAVPSSTGFRIISDPTWNDAPSIYNQFAYNVVNVSNEMAAVPSRVTQTSFSRTHLRTNTTAAVVGTPIANLTASYMRADTTSYPSNAKLIVRVGNSGWAKAPATKVAFFRVDANNVNTQLGTADAPELAPGQYADVVYTIANPTGGLFTFHARADSTAALAECNESDNVAPNVTVRFSADVAVDQALLYVSDPQPRPGDTIQLVAAADLSGAIDVSLLTVQFYLGPPASGGAPISGAMPVSLTSNRGARKVWATLDWAVTASTGPATIYVVFDAANAINEDSETNNTATLLLDVSTTEAILKLSAATTLTPPSSEPGAPISVRTLVRNIGNVPLGEVVLKYEVTGGAGSGFSGSATVPALAKYDYRELTLGTFTPAADGNYTVTITPADPAVTLVGEAKQIRIAPFAGAVMSALPARTPVTLPLVQAHTKISRTNTIVVPDDPIVPLVKAHIQMGLNWQGPVLNGAMNNNCYQCHVQAQGMVAFEASLGVSGINVDPAVQQRMYTQTVNSQNADGHFGTSGFPRTTTIVGAWQLSYWHNPEQVRPYLIKALDAMVGYQRSDGAFDCDHCAISYGNREAHTMMAMIAFARGYELTRDARYLNAINKAASWSLAYNYSATRTTGPELAARVSIGLSAVVPHIADKAFAATLENRIRNISAFLASTQNPDGSFGAMADPDYPVIRTAQALYAMSLAGVPGSDPGLRAAILWLISNQQTNGGWKEYKSKPNQVEWLDESTWAMIALPSAFLRLGQFDVDLEIFLPSSTELVGTNIAPGASRVLPGGKSLQWRFPDVSEQGFDVLMNVKLNGIQHDEQRPATGKATISYTDPYNGKAVTRDVSVPLVTGFAPLTLKVETDKEVYPPASPVTITETIANVGTSNDGITNDLIIRDANGTTVATIATNDPVTGLPARPFPGWRYTAPLSTTVSGTGVNRTVTFGVDFAQKLAEVGATGTLDRNSVRVSSDAAPNTELYFSFLAESETSARGLLVVRVPDEVPSGATFAAHVFFDVVENGFKPASLYDLRNAAGAGSGILAKYWYLNTSATNPSATLPSLVYTTTTPIQTLTHAETRVTAPAPPRGDYWGSEWTGALYVPTTGTYGFLIGSDDGSWLYIDNQLVASLPGTHGTMETSKNVTLTAGFHTIKFVVFNWCCGWAGYVKWAPPGKSYGFITRANLFTEMPVASNSGVGPAEVLPDGSVTRTYQWNTGTTAAGPYRAVGTIKQFGSFVATSGDDFAISAAAELTGTIVTDKVAYDPGETVRATGTTRYDKGNTTLQNLTATVTISDPAGAPLASAVTPIATLNAGQNVPARAEWAVGTAAAGSYQARLVVKDAQGATLIDQSVPFEVRATAQTGRGISGTISTPPSVYQGETLPISVTITNAGNSAIADAPFQVILVDPATEAPVATIPFTATAAAGATFTGNLSHVTTTLKVQTYQAWLVSMITGSAVPLAQTTFEVKVPPLKLELSIGGPARVLIWANCANGNSTQPCTPAVPQFLTRTLTDAGIPWTLVGTQYEFMAAMRTGAYDEAILYRPGAFEAKVASEYLQTIHAGYGLIYINNDTDADPKLLPALGVSYRGKLSAASTTLDVLATPFTSAGSLALDGDSATVELKGAEVAARVAATQAPAVTYFTFGSGRVVTIPYDTELTPSADVAKLLLAAVNYVPRPRVLDARRVVPIDFKVTPPPGASSSLTIEAVLPAGMTVVFAQPAFAQGTSWNVQATGTELHLYVWVRLPENAGTYELKGTAAFAGQIAVVEKTLPIAVAAGRVEMENALASDLASLAAAAQTAKDQKAIADAGAELTALRAAAPTDASAAIAGVLRLIELLQSVSLDTGGARADADRLLIYWQSRA